MSLAEHGASRENREWLEDHRKTPFNHLPGILRMCLNHCGLRDYKAIQSHKSCPISSLLLFNQGREGNNWWVGECEDKSTTAGSWPEAGHTSGENEI